MAEEELNIKEFALLEPNSPPSLSPDLEKSLGEAVNKMFDPNLAIMTGELTQRDRVCLTALYIRSKKLYLPAETGKPANNRYSQYITDYVIRSVPYKRQRSSEVVDVLKNLVSYANTKVKEGLKTKLGL